MRVGGVPFGLRLTKPSRKQPRKQNRSHGGGCHGEGTVPDALWARIAPLLPPEPPKPKGGRPRVSDRAALTGILFVLKTGIPWEYLPAEMGCRSGMTCWRRLRDWYQAGVWRRLHQVLLEELAQADRIDWDRAALDSAAVPAPGGQETGKNPTDRGKQGTKRHLVVDAHGIPLAVLVSAANVARRPRASARGAERPTAVVLPSPISWRPLYRGVSPHLPPGR